MRKCETDLIAKYIYKQSNRIVKKDLRQISDMVFDMVFYCYDLKKFKEIFSVFLNERGYIYRNEQYSLCDLIRPFLIEYIRDRIGSDKQYYDIKGISDHINNLFD